MRALERIARVLRWTAAVVLVVYVVWLLGDVLLLVFAAALFALGLRGLADLLSRASGIGSGPALAATIVALAVLLGAGGWWAGPRLAGEAARLQEQMLAEITDLKAQLEATAWGRELLRQIPAGFGGGAKGVDLVPRISGAVAGALWSAIGVLGTAVLVVATAIYFAADPRPYVSGPLRLLPQSYRQRTRDVLGAVAQTLQAWLAGLLVDMLVVGIVTGGGLALLGVSLPFILGVIAALLNFVPYVGAIAGAVPAILIALAQRPEQALLVAALFVVVQTLEGNVLAPLIQRQAVNLPPAATILAQTALGALFGLPGVILATPVAAATLATLREVTSDAS